MIDGTDKPAAPDDTDAAAAMAIAAQIERGDDPYVVPEAMLVEPEKGVPVNKSLYAQIQAMTVGEKIKLSLRGNRDARMILVRDANRLIQRFVLANPRITDDEIIMVARNRSVESELLKIIGDNKNWRRNYQIRIGLVANPKTPLSTALGLMGALQERDLRLLAKNKNVSTTISGQARRLLEHKRR